MGSTRSWRWQPIAALAVLFVFSLPAVTPRIYASDEIEFFSFLRSLWFDGDVSFDNEYRYFYESGTARNPGFHETFLERTSETGLRYNFATIGPAILWAPFYAVADLAVRIAGGGMGPRDGLSHPYIAAVAYGSAFYGFLAVVLSMVAAARVVYGSAERIPPAAVAAALAIWLGTPLCFYMYVAPPMSHASSAFAVSAFVLAWLVVRQQWSHAGLAVLGALAGLMAMVREQDFFFIIGPSLDFVAHIIQSHRQRGWTTMAREAVPRVLVAAVAFAVTYLPQALAYVALNGHLGPSNVVARKMEWTAPYAWSVLAVARTRVSDVDATGASGPVGPACACCGEPGTAERPIGAAWLWCLLAMVACPDLRDRQRRLVDARRRLRSAPVRRAHAHSRDWPRPHSSRRRGRVGCAGRWRPG